MKHVKKIVFIILLFIISCTPPQNHVKRHQSPSLATSNIARDVLRSPNLSNTRKSIIRTADSLRGVPYLAGGTTPRGFDCSGFTQYVFAKSGISLLRRADQQYENGRKIHPNQLRPGDLVFFQTTSRRISHVGIYAGNDMFIHSPSKGKNVSYTSMNNPYWKPRYRGSVSYIR